MARIRFAIRSLAKAPLLSLVVVLSLGLGIGANTAIFSLMHQMILSSLPVEKPEELVLVTSPASLKADATPPTIPAAWITSSATGCFGNWRSGRGRHRPGRIPQYRRQPGVRQADRAG